MDAPKPKRKRKRALSPPPFIAHRFRIWTERSPIVKGAISITAVVVCMTTVTAFYYGSKAWTKENIGVTPFANRDRLRATERVVAGAQFEKKTNSLLDKEEEIKVYEELKKQQGRRWPPPLEKKLRELRNERSILRKQIEVIDKTNAPVVEHPELQR